jgi:hypothetical protein
MGVSSGSRLQRLDAPPPTHRPKKCPPIRGCARIEYRMVSQRSRSSISLPSPRVAIGHSSTHAVNKLYSILRSSKSPDHSASTAPLVV